MDRRELNRIGERLQDLVEKAQRDRDPTLLARFEAERSEVLDYGGPVDWGGEVNRVMVAVREYGPHTQLPIRRQNGKQFVAELRRLLPPEVNRSVTFQISKPICLTPIGERGPLSHDLHWEYDYPPTDGG